MTSPAPPGLPEQEDVTMGAPAESEGEGDVAMPGDDDSSEESEDDQEEEARIREGFIVDEDEDEDEDEDDEQEERRRRRKKRRHRRRQREQVLEEDDLELLEENTGASFKKSRLKRLRRGRESESPPVASSSKRRDELESSEDDLDLPQVKDIQSIWDDERAGDGDEYMDDFIEYDEEGEQGAHENEERGAPRATKPKRRRAFGGRPELEGLDALAWDEIHDVFGDGHEYDWALDDDRPEDLDDITTKADLKYADVFEPSVIKSHMKTDEDEVIRVQDIPERMQLSVSNLSSATSLSPHEALSEDDLMPAAAWVTERISAKKTYDFFSAEGPHSRYQEDLVRAVTFALRHLFIRSFEVPYVWTHKNDYLSTFDVQSPATRVSLLDEEDLWRVYELGQQYRALVNRTKLLNAAYIRLSVSDDYFETEIRPRIESVEDAIDAGEWLTMKYKGKKQDALTDYHFYDDAEPVDVGPKHKLPTRTSAYEVAKKSVVSRLANGFGIRSHEIVQNIKSGQNVNFVEDQDLPPLVYAEQFTDPDPEKALPPEELLGKARMIIATELGKDPILRRDIRSLYQKEALISCTPTDKGVMKITPFDKVFTSKYLKDKCITDLEQTDQFLEILKAETEGSLTISITLPPDTMSAFESQLRNAFSSDGFSESVKLWNTERLLVVTETLEKHLVPAGVKWAREFIALQEQEFLANVAGQCLLNRIDTHPYHGKGGNKNEVPTVLAISWGQGEAHKDPISMVTLDSLGRVRDSTIIDNLVDQDNRDEFVDLVTNRREITIIVVGGFSASTAKLSARIIEILKALKPDNQDDHIPVIYAYDDVARLYMQSQRALEEFPSLTKVQRYCVGLGRYLQSPLNEFAALGEDISVVRLLPEQYDHGVIPKEKLLKALEKALVTVVQRTGVDINRAVNDSYYAHLLPLVCGLGRRKADLLINKISQMGGSLVNRDQFVKNDLLTHTIFMNAASFLRITQDSDVRQLKGRHNDDDAQDPLDNTRIHPEDYELARKMATDALELDEEDIHDEHPSYVVSQLLQDSERYRKVNELSLDEFAISLLEANQERKRYVLDNIRQELLVPYGEMRGQYKRTLHHRKTDDKRFSGRFQDFSISPPANDWELDDAIILLQLTGETMSTVGRGCTVTGVVMRIVKGSAFVRLDSGLEGSVRGDDLDQILSKGKAVTATVDKLNVKELSCELSLDNNVGMQRGYQPDPHHWDHSRYERDQEMVARKKKAEVNRSRRVIKHPNFHNFNSGQAETYLEQQQRGDVVIRPSSKGQDHLAVTWKVDSGLYQHIDVTEPGADVNGLAVSELIVDAAHRYTDLDELIVNQIQAMARRVEELMAHEKFKPGSEDELHLYLKNYLLANPNKSMYGFTLNRRKPGHFNLCFLANKDSPVQTWPIRITPEAYYLFDAPAAGVSELCDAFKVRYIHLQQTQSLGPSGGRTPYGRTPGHVSIRQPARTPNPYGGASAYTAPAPSYGGGSTWGGGTAAPPASSWGGTNGAPPPPPPTQYPLQTPSWSGHQTPRNPAPPPPQAGIHPSRMEMLQQQSGGEWGGAGWS